MVAPVGFLSSLLHVCKRYAIAMILFLLLVAWVLYEIPSMGAWVMGSITQTALLGISVHILLCIGDFDFYGSQSKVAYCDSCNEWLRVEFLLFTFQTILFMFAAPHWPLPFLLCLAYGFEVYVCVQFPEYRTLDPLTIYKMKRALYGSVGWKIGVHVLLFLSYLAYVGPWTILVAE